MLALQVADAARDAHPTGADAAQRFELFLDDDRRRVEEDRFGFLAAEGQRVRPGACIYVELLDLVARVEFFVGDVFEPAIDIGGRFGIAGTFDFAGEFRREVPDFRGRADLNRFRRVDVRSREAGSGPCE